MSSSKGVRRATFAEFTVDFERFELRKHGTRLRLQHQPFQILKLLLEHPGELVTREELRAQLWTDSTFVDFDAGLNAAVRRLRDALNDSAETPRYIATVPRRGYRFVAPAEIVQLPQQTAAPVSETPVLASGDPALPVGAARETSHALQGGQNKTSQRISHSLSIGIALAGFALCIVLLSDTVLTRRGHHSRIYSIAVLPLQNLSGNPSEDYFADGMTDALVTSLAQSNSLKVISSTSSMRYKGKDKGKSLAEIAKELNVELIVEGSVTRSGNRVSVTAQLLDGVKDQHLWAHRYDREMQDVLQLQSDLASAIATEVAGKLSPTDESRLKASARPVNPEAYEAYLKGEYFIGRWTHSGFEKAKNYYEKAVGIDPGYVDGQVGLASYYAISAFTHTAPSENWLTAETLVQKALQIDSNSAKAHTLLGMIKLQFRCDRVGAERELNRALELSPGDMNALDYHSYYLLEIGETEQAIAEKRIVLSHDPVSVTTNAELGLYLVLAGRNQEAIPQLKRAIELDPDYAAAHIRLGRAYAGLGQYSEASAEIKQAISLDADARELRYLGEVYARWGKRDEAIQQISQLKKMNEQGHPVSTEIALIYTQLGNKDAALMWLAKAKPEDDPELSDPGFDNIRSDPRFERVQEHLRLNPACPAF